MRIPKYGHPERYSPIIEYRCNSRENRSDMKDDLVLNKKQKEAVEFRQGPLLIVAGAGTGKTTVITERIKFLIRSEAASPAQILALTFTEKAAREMEERVDIAMPYGYTQMWISTFHAFGTQILRREALHIGLNPNYKLMTEAEAIQVIRRNLFQFKLNYFRPLGNPTKFVGGLLQHFSRLQDEDVGPSEYLKFAMSLGKKANKSREEKLEVEKTLELARAYQQFGELKIKEGYMDYGDLIGNTLLLFRKRKNVLKTYQEQFKYMLVDEFQDTNFAQYEMLKLLVPPGKRANLTVVGDDSQCLPPTAIIATPDGGKAIQEINRRDEVITAIGKGHTSVARVSRVFRRKRRARLLTFKTEDGKKITLTDNHKMFCFLPAYYPLTGWHFVYLMHQQGIGWRIGVTNSIPQRLRLETHADTILAIGSYKTDQEARFFEAYYAE